MTNKSNKKATPSFSTAEFMISVLRPVLDEWNRVITTEAWGVERNTTGGVSITEFNHRDNIHGILASHIAGICAAYGWCWAIYAREEGGIEVIIH